jgi:hypothetical protein
MRKNKFLILKFTIVNLSDYTYYNEKEYLKMNIFLINDKIYESKFTVFFQTKSRKI